MSPFRYNDVLRGFEWVTIDMMFRYYSKQLRDDKLKQRRARVAEERKKEEQERLQHFGLTNGKQYNS